jgi:hypothetical protein
MPQIGQAPGPIWTISGCIGQVYSVAGGWWLVAGRVLGAGVLWCWGAEVPDAVTNDSGFAVNRLRQPVPQK